MIDFICSRNSWQSVRKDLLPLFVSRLPKLTAEAVSNHHLENGRQMQVEPVTTQYLYNACMDAANQDDRQYTRTYCLAFIQGAVNAHIHLTSSYNFPSQYCLPIANVEKKMAGIFIKYVEDNPHIFKKPVIQTLYYALHDAFPCPESQSAK
ncbi:MAG: hypothetical protein AMK70_07875 [Nitrospira bacterium SG8_35_1]|nr:MAG: hypothetical protein AMK70_07875 [Nitrospira bacterium SG8_35_1]